jgi:hypothetical protein
MNGVCQSSLCVQGEVSWNGTCYYFGVNPTTWDGGESDCEIRGMSLASVESREENEFIALNITDATWFGLVNQFQTAGSWTWYATGQPLYFANWAPGQPPGDTTLGCGYIGKDGMWVAQRCTAGFPYVCERTNVCCVGCC